MPRRRRDPYICPVCGTRVEPKKTWQIVSPLPDAQGRVTVTIMGSFECPNCGHKWRAAISKIKVGAEGVEFESGSTKLQEKRKQEEERRGEIIEIDIDEE